VEMRSQCRQENGVKITNVGCDLMINFKVVASSPSNLSVRIQKKLGKFIFVKRDHDGYRIPVSLMRNTLQYVMDRDRHILFLVQSFVNNVG
jgi:hypothetical protein